MMVLVGKMLERIDGLRGTKDLNRWEENFVESAHKKYANSGNDSTVLSDKQVEIIEQIHNKHFA